MRIERRVFKYVEYELYNYDNTKKELERYRKMILESSPAPAEVKTQGGQITSQTESKALKLITSSFIVHAERVISAIDKSLAMLTEDHRKLFQLKYQECLPWQEIIVEMNISDRTYFRMRRELVATVARQLGLINVE